MFCLHLFNHTSQQALEVSSKMNPSGDENDKAQSGEELTQGHLNNWHTSKWNPEQTVLIGAG